MTHPVGLGWGLRICVSDSLLNDAGPGNHTLGTTGFEDTPPPPPAPSPQEAVGDVHSACWLKPGSQYERPGAGTQWSEESKKEASCVLNLKVSFLKP